MAIAQPSQLRADFARRPSAQAEPGRQGLVTLSDSVVRRKETESPALTATATPGMLYLGMEGVGPAASVVTRRTVSVTGGGAAAPSAGPVRA